MIDPTRAKDALFQNQNAAVIVCNADRVIRHVNPAFEALFGYAPHEALGRSTHFLYSREGSYDSVGAAHLDPDQPISAEPYTMSYRRRNGTEFCGSTIIVPMRGPSGEAEGVIGIVRDVTVRERTDRAFRTLYAIVADRTKDPAAKARAILAFGCEYFGLPLGIVSRIENGRYTVVHVHAPGGEIEVGAQFELADTYCREVLQADGPVSLHHAGRTDADHPCYRTTGLEAYLGAPVHVGERRYGTINFSSGEPREAPFSAHDLEMIGMFADWITGQVTIERSLHHLEQARQRAEDASESKSRFLANMSHEIRTPMTGVLGHADLLLASELTGEQRRWAQRIEGAGRILLRILNDILDLSRMEAGRLEVETQPLSLEMLIGDCEALMTPAAEEKGIALRTETAPDLPAGLLGDALRLRQILLNLLGNAVKFTAKGSVTLACARGAAGDLRIEVRDTGIGIPAERLDSVMRDFVQADPSTQRRYGGTGLGLAISRKLASLMGGRLHLESAVGAGTTAVLSLPLTEVAPPEALGTTPQEGVKVEIGTRRVLVVEDVEFNRDMFEAMLSGMGFEVATAGNGREAIEAAKGEGDAPFDLVLMDVQMPDVDGLTATKAIRRLPGWASRPILALTAGAFPDEIGACLEAGMNDHISKPATAAILREKATEWIGREARAAPPGATLRTVGEDAAEGTLSLDEALADVPEEARLRLLDKFADMTASATAELAVILGAEDPTSGRLGEIAAIAHKVKGSARVFGLHGLERSATEAEAAALEGSEPPLEAFTEELRRASAMCERTRRAAA